MSNRAHNDATRVAVGQVQNRGRITVRELQKEVGWVTARSALYDLEQRDWVVRSGPDASVYWLGRTLADLLWMDSQPVMMPREAIECYADEPLGDVDE
ncbi:hypothetical protein N0B31_17725 [Salinirubellus salinus]|uniref:Uncharacterized protein n=1 Tax=Salinirubellus salinus TaxID=1364945 RepID=A0A9E7R1K6_9EURY|nr:hypothetical protein [Salinirubellus salinus]UWM53952.1 hypothetical protein N0B31_17725 [Salinirubellus salinus]